MKKPKFIKKFISHDLECLILRNPEFFMLLGYVRIPESSLFFNRSFRDTPSFDVHGGITFSGKIHGYDGWWIGFDCGHAWDIMPALFEVLNEITPDSQYRNIEYVEKELINLASQISEFLNKNGTHYESK